MLLRVIIAGGTGLVGRQLLNLLCAAPRIDAVVSVGRRPSGSTHAKLEERIGAADQWPQLMEGGFDVACSALGTTIRDAGSQEAFFAIDHDLVLAFARAACGAGTRQFLMISSVGAHAASRNFYLATKGKAETAIANIGFERIDIVRPGLLRGQREGRLRLGERLAIALSPITDVLTPHVLSRYRSIAAANVAQSLLALTGAEEAGQFIHHNEDMLRLSRGAF